jgi:glyoxylase-like metal-dependent hydrolase (beta-lactamase superfamily II)
MPDDHPPDGVILIRADNPGPLTLTGTNSWLVRARGGGVVAIDPGPAMPDHLEALVEAAAPAGGIRAIALTHRHPDHAPGGLVLGERLGVPVHASPPPRPADAPPTEELVDVIPDVAVADGDDILGLTALAAPGHSVDHLVFITPDGVLFTGDVVLGTGSVLVSPHGGSMSTYLATLRRLQRLDLTWICPGHGPMVAEPHAKLAEYVAHRLAREAAVVGALDDVPRSLDELLAAAYADTPEAMWFAARLPLLAHLDKLVEEGRAQRDAAGWRRAAA